MAQEEESAAPRVQRLRRQLWWERAAFATIVAVGLAYYYFALQGGGACLIAVDGKPTVVVKSRAVAQRVLGQIREGAGEVKGATFLQKVTLHRVSAQDNRIVSDVAALETLSPKLTLVVQGAGVFANGRLLFGVPDQQEAVSALSRLLKEFSPPDPDLTRAFREEVGVRDTLIPASLFLPSAKAVVGKVQQMTASRGTHVVQRGETAWKIADKYRVSLDRLAAANPGVKLHLLHEDDRLTLPGDPPPLTVIAWKEVEEPITRGAQAGRFLTVRTVYENGVRTERAVTRRPSRPQPKPTRPRRSTPRRSRPRADREVSPPATPPQAPPPQAAPPEVTPPRATPPAEVTAQVPTQTREENPSPPTNLTPDPKPETRGPNP